MRATFETEISIMLEMVKNYPFAFIQRLSTCQFIGKGNQNFCVFRKHFAFFQQAFSDEKQLYQ